MTSASAAAATAASDLASALAALRSAGTLLVEQARAKQQSGSTSSSSLDPTAAAASRRQLATAGALALLRLKATLRAAAEAADLARAGASSARAEADAAALAVASLAYEARHYDREIQAARDYASSFSEEEIDLVSLEEFWATAPAELREKAKKKAGQRDEEGEGEARKESSSDQDQEETATAPAKKHALTLARLEHERASRVQGAVEARDAKAACEAAEAAAALSLRVWVATWASPAPWPMSVVQTRKKVILPVGRRLLVSMLELEPTIVNPGLVQEGLIITRSASLAIGSSAWQTLELKAPTTPRTAWLPASAVMFEAPWVGSWAPVAALVSSLLITVIVQPFRVLLALAWSTARTAPCWVGSPSEASLPLTGSSVATVTLPVQPEAPLLVPCVLVVPQAAAPRARSASSVVSWNRFGMGSPSVGKLRPRRPPAAWASGPDIRAALHCVNS